MTDHLNTSFEGSFAPKHQSLSEDTSLASSFINMGESPLINQSVQIEVLQKSKEYYQKIVKQRDAEVRRLKLMLLEKFCDKSELMEILETDIREIERAQATLIDLAGILPNPDVKDLMMKLVEEQRETTYFQEKRNRLNKDRHRPSKAKESLKRIRKSISTFLEGFASTICDQHAKESLQELTQLSKYGKEIEYSLEICFELVTLEYKRMFKELESASSQIKDLKEKNLRIKDQLILAQLSFESMGKINTDRAALNNKKIDPGFKHLNILGLNNMITEANYTTEDLKSTKRELCCNDTATKTGCNELQHDIQSLSEKENQVVMVKLNKKDKQVERRMVMIQ